MTEAVKGQALQGWEFFWRFKIEFRDILPPNEEGTLGVELESSISMKNNCVHLLCPN